MRVLQALADAVTVTAAGGRRVDQECLTEVRRRRPFLGHDRLATAILEAIEQEIARGE